MTNIMITKLKCKSLARETSNYDRIAALTGWAEGVDIFRVLNVLYLPQYGVQVCHGFVPEEAINYSMHLDVILGLPGKPSSPIDSIIDPETCEHSPDEVCILGHMFSQVFGHWAEELLKVVLLEAFGFSGSYVIKNDYPRFCRESLALLGIRSDRVINADKPIIYRAAFLTTPVHHFTATRYPKVIRRLRDRLHEAAGRAFGVGRRIWVERGVKAHGRDIINRDEVNACIRRHGFISVDFGQYSFREQIAIDRDMDVMAGPHGSAFVHCGFMRDEREVVEIFSPNHINPSVIQLCHVMQHRYNQIVPVHQDYLPYQFGKEIMVDIDHLDLVLSSLRARPLRGVRLWSR
jgi:capsular polysaccharide biosynthesis protein